MGRYTLGNKMTQKGVGSHIHLLQNGVTCKVLGQRDVTDRLFAARLCLQTEFSS